MTGIIWHAVSDPDKRGLAKLDEVIANYKQNGIELVEQEELEFGRIRALFFNDEVWEVLPVAEDFISGRDYACAFIDSQIDKYLIQQIIESHPTRFNKGKMVSFY